jgi:hypothetical protein
MSVFKVYLRELLESPDLRLATAQTAPPDPNLKRFMARYPKLFGAMTGLPVDRPETMAIDTDPEKPLPRSRPLAHLSETELSSLKATLTDLLARGFIRPFTSEYGAAILFARKADGSLRLCIDYRGLNNITKKMQGPLPIIGEMRNRLAGARVFSKLDLRDGYHNVRIKDSDIHKTAKRSLRIETPNLPQPSGPRSPRASRSKLASPLHAISKQMARRRSR